MSRSVGLTISLNNYAAFKAELQTLDRVIADLDHRIDTAGASFDKLDRAVDKTEHSTDEFEKEFKDAANTVGKETKNIDDGISRLTRTAQTLENIGTKVAIGISAPAAAIKAFAADAAIQFESSFAGVVKTLDTTGLSAEQTATVLGELRQGIRDLATDVNSPLAGLENAHNELARIAELGSQLGVARDSVLEFTETIGLLAMTSDMTADAGATNIAQFANIMQSTAFDRIGSTIVELGNKSAATESQIIEFGQRLAGAGAQAGFTEADVLGLGAAMASVGLNAEAGGTAITRVLNEMIAATAGFETGTVSAATRITQIEGDLTTLQQERLLVLRDLESAQDRLNRATTTSSRNSALTAIEQETSALAQLDAQIAALSGDISALDGVSTISFTNASEQLELFAAVAGVSVEEFATLFTEDAAGAVEMFVTGLSEMSSGDLLTALQDLGFDDVRVADTLRRLAQAPELLADSFDIAGQAFEENSAMQTEAQKRFETTAAQINLLKNNITDLAISLGDALLPGINASIDALVSFIQFFQDASPAAFRFTAALLGIAAAAGPAMLFVAQLIKAYEFLSLTFTLPTWHILAAGIAIVGLVIYDLKNNIGGARDELVELGTNLGNLFNTIGEIVSSIIGIFQSLFNIIPQSERAFSPVAAVLDVINDQIINITTSLSRLRDFLNVINGALGNSTSSLRSTTTDSERNRLLEERRNLLEEITGLEEQGLATQTEALSVQVESGDTLWDIALANNTTVEELMRLNELDSSVLQIGQELLIAGGVATASTEILNLRNELTAVDEMLRQMPTGVQSAFDAFAETPLFERIFGSDDGARDRAVVALAGIRAEADEIQTAIGAIATGFTSLFTGDFDAGIENIRTGLSSIVDSVREMFTLFSNAGPQIDTPLVALTGDMGEESGDNIFAGLGERIKNGLEEIANGDYSSVQTLLENNLGAIFTTAATILGSMFLPPLGILMGLAAKMVGAMEMDFSDIQTLFQNSTILQSIQDGLASLFGGGGGGFMLAGDEEMFGMSGGAADGLFAPITNAFQSFVDTIQPIITTIQFVWENSLQPAFDTLITGIGDFKTRFTAALDIEAIQTNVDGLDYVVATIVAAISTLIFWVGFSTGPIIAGIGSMLGDLGAAIGEFINIVTLALSGDFLGAGLAIWGFVRNLGNALGSFVEGSADSIINFLESLTGMDFMSAEEVLTGIKDTLGSIADMTIGEGLRTLHEFITNIATGNFENTALGRFLAGLPDMFGNAFRAIGREIAIVIDSFILKWQEIQAMLPGGGEGDANAIAETQQRLQSNMVMGEAFSAIGPEGVNLDIPISFTMNGEQVTNPLSDWLRQPGILDAASADSQAFLEQAMTTAAQNADSETFWQLYFAAINSGFHGENFDFAGLQTLLTENLDAAAIAEETAAIGENVVTGFTTGLTDNESLAVDGTVTFTDAVRTAMEEGFETHSPSVWMQEVGLYLMEGLQLGLINNLPLLEVAFMLLKEQFAPIVASLNVMFDSVILKEQTMIEMMKIAGQVWGTELKGMDKGINRIGASIGGLIPKILEFISLMGKIPAIAIINLQGTAPGTPPPNQAVATVHAQGGPGFAGMIAKVAEPEIGGIEIIRQDGGGTYIVSGRDFMAVPPTSMPMSAPVGSLPMPPAAMSGSSFGGSSIIFEQPVIIENPSGAPVTPETIATGMQQWQRSNPPRRQLRDSL